MKQEIPVHRVTISLPLSLYTRGEEERARQHLTRSEFVARLYCRYLDEVEERRRVERYASAYALQPETEEERSWAGAAAEVLGATIEE